MVLTVALGAALLVASPLPAQTGFPFSDEHLTYSVNWPSGIALGEGRLHAVRTSGQWDFELTLQAELPGGFLLSDQYRSKASTEWCSLELEKKISRGKRVSSETTVFHQEKNTATRGNKDIPVPPCAKDALTFLFYTRRELGQGRLPPAQTILLGAAYEIRMEYTGLQPVRVNSRNENADRVNVAVKGPASAVSFEMFFARDVARTPLAIRVPFSLGTFSLELVR